MKIYQGFLGLMLALTIVIGGFATYNTVTNNTIGGVGGGLGTIEQLDQWKSDGTNITQNVEDRPLKFTGLESAGECLVTNASGVVSVSSCGGAGTVDGSGSASHVTYWSDSNTLTSVATGTLSESVTGLEFNASRYLIGGSATLALTSGYNVPLTASTTEWTSFYQTPSGRITAGTGIDWTGNTLNGVYTAGDGLTLTAEDFDCDTASGSIFGCLTSTDWNTFNGKQSAITFGTGVQAALGVNIGSAGAPVLFNGALGTPTSGTVTNLTGTASININGTVGATTPTTIVGTTITGNTSVTSPIHSSNNADPADAGIVRLGNAELIAWEASPAGTDASLSVNSSERVVWTGVGAIIPSANDGFSLGVSGTAVSDLFLASGGVINWNAGNSTITHSAGLLTSNVNIAVPDNAYASTWNASTSVPTKNAVYDIIETLGRIAGQVWTGVHDFGGATSIEIVNGTGPAVDTTGEIALDTTDNQLLVATGTAARAIPTITKLWGGTIASTSVDFASGGRIPLPPHRDGVVITEFHCFVDGGTSKVLNIDTMAGGAQLDSVTCATTLTSDTAQSANYSLSAGALQALEFGATTGTVDYVTFSAWGYIKPE